MIPVRAVLRASSRGCLRVHQQHSGAWSWYSTRRGCSSSVKGGDEEFLQAHEAQVNRHRDIFHPVLSVVGAVTLAWFMRRTYVKLTERDANGKSVFDLLIFHKRDAILGDKPEARANQPTLLLDINDVLVTTTFREGSKTVQTVKRPGLDVFLNRLKNHYEIVVYTLSDLNYSQDLYARLDPKWEIFSNLITRELIKRVDSGDKPFGIIPSFLAPQYKKNLQDIGRRPERVIHLDANPSSFYNDPAQNDNRIVIPRYDGKDSDRELLYLIPFLEYLADKNRAPFDLRRAIRFYNNKAQEYGVDNIGVAYLVYQEEKKKKEKEKSRNATGGFFSGMSSLLAGA